MFDFVNLEVRNLLLKKWLENPILRENGFGDIVVNEDTGEIKDRCKAEYKGLTFKLITSSKIAGEYVKVMSGSLHKYFNGGEHNYNRFTHDDCVRIINELSATFDIVPADSVLHGLEFGVNLYLPYSPQRVIKSVVVHRNKPYEAINKNRRNGVVCVRDGYEIKIYDKGFVSGQPQRNILRIEYKVLKMRELEPYKIALLSDLCDHTKVNPLLDLLVDAVNDTVFIPHDTDVTTLSESQLVKFQSMRIPFFWKELTRRNRVYSKIVLDGILKKCNAFEQQNDLKSKVCEEWKRCIITPNEANKIVTFTPLFNDNEAIEIVTFTPLEYTVQTLQNPLEIENRENEPESEVFDSQIRTCKTCGKPIEKQRLDSLFCSIKFNPLAKRCRNKDSNKRRTFKAQIMRAKETEKYIRVTYKNLEDPTQQTETVTLKSSEIAVSRGWLNTIVRIEILHDEPNLYGCPNEPQPEILTGVDAKNYASRLTRENE
jgi:hypothetical protein